MAAFVFACLVSYPVGAIAQQTSVPAQLIAYPEMVLYNGKIITADDDFTIAEAVAIRDGKFLAVGSSKEILALAGPQTNRIDLEGTKSVIPGLIDSHGHGAWVGNEAKRGKSGSVDFADMPKALADIQKLVDAAAPGEWIILSGPRTKNFYSTTRRNLDQVSPHTPVIFLTSSQEVLANSVVLELANLPSDMYGVIKDQKTGEPTGQLYGHAAGVVTYELMPWSTLNAELLEEQKATLKRLNAEGLTTNIGRAQGLSISILNELAQRGELTVRARVAMDMTRLNPNLESYLKRTGNLTGIGDDWLRIIGGTVQPVDGSSGDGSMLAKQNKIRRGPEDPFERGANKWTAYGPIDQGLPNQKTEANSVLIANRHGWAITGVHSQGDLGSEVLLESYRAAHQENPIDARKFRFGFDHGLLRTKENFELARQLGVNESLDMKYVFDERPDDLIFNYGADAVHRMSPVKTLIDAGMKPIVEGDRSLWQIEKLVTRKDETGRVWGAHEKVSRDIALRMRTNWAAYYSGDQDTVGSIEVGKFADLVVLGADYMTVPEDGISELPVLLTVVGGRVVYDRARDGAIQPPTPAGGRIDR
jgi:predicted amidohydrolase YtcJ